MIVENKKIEFELTIKKSENENAYNNSPYYDRQEKREPKWEVVETLNFKGLSAVETLRKLIDYLQG
jgi:predicted RNA-binding protein with PUA-like domain